MVIDDQRRDRGQIILIAAVVIAFIVLGVVVVFNGVLYTETISSSSTSQSTADAELVDQELEAAIVDLGRHVNDDGSLGESEFRTALEDPDGLFDQYQETKANSQSVLVSADVDTVVVGTAGEPLDNETIQFNGNPVDHFEVALTDATGDVTIEANRTGGPVDEITLEGVGDGYDLADPGTTCEIESESARVDLLTGAVTAPTNGDCDAELDLVADGTNYEEIEITTDMSSGTYDYGPSSDDDVLAVTLDVTYESSTVSYLDETREIRVYGESR